MAKTVTIDYNDGKYTGEVNASKIPHGKGKLVMEYLGCTYEGDFVSGEMTGYGRMTWDSGAVYEGEFVNGARHGTGKMTYTDGRVFDGEWADDLFTDTPVHTSNNDSEDEDTPTPVVAMDYNDGAYEGQTNAQGKPHGRGKLVLDFLGCTYEGEFVNGEMTGRGKMVWDTEAVYNGYFENGMRHGYGEMTFADKTKKCGNWEMDLLIEECSAPRDFIADLDEALSHHGAIPTERVERPAEKTRVATINYEGGFYEGEVNEASVPHGRGVIRWNDNECSYDGEWKNGVPHGFGKKLWDDGDRCEGILVDGVFCGEGKFFFADGDIYEGGFKDDTFNGHGKFTMTNGDIYEGDFVDGDFSGHGKMTYASGSVYDGAWVGGKWSGKGSYTVKEGAKALVYKSDNWSDAGFADTLTRFDGEYTDEGKMVAFSFTATRLTERYEGEKNFKGQPHGEGKMIYADGSTYEGGWAYGKWYRQGTYKTADGKTYVGYFSSTKQSLNITLIDGSRRISGTMDDGEFFAI